MGLQQLSAATIVKIKVVDKETPIFDQLAYDKVVPEDVKVGEGICRVQARSPGGADILYTIMQGDPLNQFAIDLKTGEWLSGLKIFQITVVKRRSNRSFSQLQPIITPAS